jgi:hypothetical protein
MTTRRMWIGLGTLAFIVGVLPGVASAESFAGIDTQGDVPYCQGDLVAVGSAYQDGTISVSGTSACSINPRTDPSWKDGDGGIIWPVDTDGDQPAEYLIVEGNDGNGALVAAVLDSSLRLVCSASADWDGDRTFKVSVAGSCLGSPASIRTAGVLGYDENPSGTCTCPVDYAPTNGGYYNAIANSTTPPPSSGKKGYWMIGRTGDTYAFGDAPSLGNTTAPADVVDLEPTSTGKGYWTVDSAGNVFTHGDARYFGGGAGGLSSGERVTALSQTRDGGGYWLFTSLGRVLAFGNATHYGDMGGTKLNGPVLDSIPTTSGKGYYMVGSDGGIFTFGDAAFLGSMGDVKLNAPVQSLVPDTDGSGYWLVASDGGIFAFDAPFYGSMGSTTLNKPVTGMVGFGNGYLMVAEDGGIFTFGDAPFFGSLGDQPPAQPIVSTAVLNS